MKIRLAIYVCAISLALLAMVGGQSVRAAVDVKSATANIQDTIQFVATADEYDDRPELEAMVLYSLHLLREPNPDGATYRYATVEKEVESKPMLSEKVMADYQEKAKQTISIESSTVTSFQIRSPLHRGFFKNNGNIYIYSYTVEYSINGQTRTDQKKYDQWITRDTTIDVDIPGISEWAKLSVDIAANPGDIDKSVIHLYAQFPVVKDDPMNPFTYSVRQLEAALSVVQEGRRVKDMTKNLENALQGISKVPEAVGGEVPDTTMPASQLNVSEEELKDKLRYIQYLVEQGGDLELEEAVDQLKGLIHDLK